MELLQIENFLNLRGLVLVLLAIIFLLSVLLMISGVKIKNERVKGVSIFFGGVLGLTAILLFIFTFIFGFNS